MTELTPRALGTWMRLRWAWHASRGDRGWGCVSCGAMRRPHAPWASLWALSLPAPSILLSLELGLVRIGSMSQVVTRSPGQARGTAWACTRHGLVLGMGLYSAWLVFLPMQSRTPVRTLLPVLLPVLLSSSHCCTPVSPPFPVHLSVFSPCDPVCLLPPVLLCDLLPCPPSFSSYCPPLGSSSAQLHCARWRSWSRPHMPLEGSTWPAS